MLFNILATFAEFEVDLLRVRTSEDRAVARAKGKLKGRQPKLSKRRQGELARMHETCEPGSAWKPSGGSLTEGVGASRMVSAGRGGGGTLIPSRPQGSPP